MLPTSASAAAGTNPGNNTSRGTSGLDTAGWLRGHIIMESVKSSVFTKNKDLIDPIKTTGTNKVIQIASMLPILKISDKDDGVYRDNGEVTIAKTKALRGAGFMGRTTPEGTEETLRTEQLTVSANLYGTALASWNLGIDKLNDEWLKQNSHIPALLSQWVGETTDRKIHQAYLERASFEQTVAPSSIQQALNPNILFADTAAGPDGVVPYALGTAHVDAVVDAADNTLDENNHLSVRRIITIGDQCSDSYYMKPVSVNGGLFFIMYAAPEEIRVLLDSQAAGSYASEWISSRALEEAQKVVPDAVMGIRNILVVEDKRNATMEITGNATTGWISTAGYVGPGRTSTRPTVLDTPQRAFNANIVVGRESLVNYTRQATSFAKASDGYQWTKGDAIYNVDSYTLPCFDVDTATATSIKNEGSLIVLTARESNLGE